MANSIALNKKYVPLLDEVYQKSAITAILDSDSELFREGANANEIIVPKIDMQGLANYSRNSGYTNGDVTLTNETVQYNYERGRMFSVDSMDNEETAGVAFGKLAGEFIRTKVVPEVDAFRFAKYSSLAGASDSADLTGNDWYDAVSEAKAQMEDDEVPLEDMYLFIVSKGKKAIDDMDTTKSRECMDDFAGVITVPQKRFYSAIDLIASGNGGYSKNASAKNINFMIISRSALIQTTKHAVPKIISPEVNQEADAWKFGYRNYGLADVYENKTAGVYAHFATK